MESTLRINPAELCAYNGKENNFKERINASIKKNCAQMTDVIFNMTAIFNDDNNMLTKYL